MNARISRKFAFHAAIHHEETFIVNDYDLELFMDVTTDDIDKQNIAMDRIKYIFDISFDSCIFVDVHDAKALDIYSKANMKVCPLPDEPFDQVIASVIISKVNAITEKHIFLEEVKIMSRICDDVCFHVSYEEEADFHNLKDVWWTDNSPIISTIKKSKKEKVVQLHKKPLDWKSVGLGWENLIVKKCDKGEVVFIPVDK
jgi:hypothetical protein